MDFKLSKTHLLQQEMYRRFAENEVKPLAEEMDETEVYSMELLAKMHKYGLMGIPYSKEYGGVGGDYLSYALCMEEVSKMDGSTGITISKSIIQLMRGYILYHTLSSSKLSFICSSTIDRISFIPSVHSQSSSI